MWLEFVVLPVLSIGLTVALVAAFICFLRMLNLELRNMELEGKLKDERAARVALDVENGLLKVSVITAQSRRDVLQKAHKNCVDRLDFINKLSDLDQRFEEVVAPKEEAVPPIALASVSEINAAECCDECGEEADDCSCGEDDWKDFDKQRIPQARVRSNLASSV